MRSFLVKKGKINIGVLGLWHLGSVYSACLAKLGFEVFGFDENEAVINNLKKSKPPIDEPQLQETIQRYNKKNLHFTSLANEAITDKDFVFLTYDTPVDNNDQVDLSLINSTVNLLNNYLTEGTTIVVSSQVPIGYCRKLLQKVDSENRSVSIIYFPENLRLGTAFESFLKPDRVVIGSNDSRALDNFEQVFSDLNCPFIKIGLESAEMTKHALNSYLALNISFSSEISDLSEKLGADMNEVVKALKTDSRVSPKAPLNPGLGFAGGTLGRDVQTLRNLGKKARFKTLLLDSVYSVNKNRLPQLLEKIEKYYPILKNKNVGILGLTYKPETNTLRRSMSLELAKILRLKGAKISAFDPAIKEQITDFPFINVEKSISTFFEDLDFVILMTPWPDFKKISIGKYLKNKTLFDTKNFLQKKDIEYSGVKYIGMGYPQ